MILNLFILEKKKNSISPKGSLPLKSVWSCCPTAFQNFHIPKYTVLRSVTFLMVTILTRIWLNSFFFLSLNRTFGNNWYISIMTVKMYIQVHHGRIKLHCSITWKKHHMNLSMNKDVECCGKNEFFTFWCYKNYPQTRVSGLAMSNFSQ